MPVENTTEIVYGFLWDVVSSAKDAQASTTNTSGTELNNNDV